VTRLVDCCCPWRQEAGGQRSLLLKLSVERRCPVSYGILIQLAARVIDRLAYRAPLLMGFKAGIAEFGGGLVFALLVRSAGRNRKLSA
jgi:hypothetical protein